MTVKLIIVNHIIKQKEKNNEVYIKYITRYNFCNWLGFYIWLAINYKVRNVGEGG